jgi:hypothetical protein
MNNIVLDTPYVITLTKNITKFDIDEIKVNLNQSASIRVFLKNDENEISDIKTITLEGEDYSNWGEDDEYIINYIKNLLENNLI